MNIKTNYSFIVFQSQLGAENMPDDQTIQDINSVAAKLVLAKGYTQEDVENSIKFVRQKYGKYIQKSLSRITWDFC